MSKNNFSSQLIGWWFSHECSARGTTEGRPVHPEFTHREHFNRDTKLDLLGFWAEGSKEGQSSPTFDL